MRRAEQVPGLVPMHPRTPIFSECGPVQNVDLQRSSGEQLCPARRLHAAKRVKQARGGIIASPPMTRSEGGECLNNYNQGLQLQMLSMCISRTGDQGRQAQLCQICSEAIQAGADHGAICLISACMTCAKGQLLHAHS